jgi:hypothetical protein
MFFPTLALYSKRRIGNISGAEEPVEVSFSLGGPDIGTILAIGNEDVDIPLSFVAETNLVLGSNTSSVPLALSPDNVIILGNAEIEFPLTLSN